MPTNPRLLGHLFAFVTIAIWSAAFVSNKVLIAHLSPIEIMIDRFVLAYVVLWLIHPRGRLPRSWRDEAFFFVLGALGIFVYFLFENFALKYTQATNVGLFMGAIPLFTAILSHYIHPDEHFTRKLLLGFVIAMTGMGMILLEGHDLQLRFRGDMLALLGAITFALYSALLKKAPQDYHYIEITRKSFFYGLLLMSGWHIARGEPLHLSPLALPVVWLNLLYLGLLSSGLAFILYHQGIKRIGSIAASNYIYLVPLLTAIVGVIALNEVITSTMLLAGGLILLGLYIAQKTS
jgi:drug/metabolite transporter (DMT)-like permease